MSIPIVIPKIKELQCKSCGYTSTDYIVEKKIFKNNTTHHAGNCSKCGSFIEWVSQKESNRNIPRESKIFANNRTKGLCSYCGVYVNDEVSNQRHYDHQNPFSKKGLNSPENIFLSCQRCNLGKYNKNLEEFRSFAESKTKTGSILFHFEMFPHEEKLKEYKSKIEARRFKGFKKEDK